MTSPLYHRAVYQAPPSPPWPPSLALSPTYPPLYLNPFKTFTPCIPSFLAHLTHHYPSLSHLSTALDPLHQVNLGTKACFTPIYSRIQATIQTHLKTHQIQQWSLKADQEGSSEVPKLKIESKNQEKEPLKSLLGVRTRKPHFDPFLAQVIEQLMARIMSSPTHPTPSDVDEECAFPSANILDYTSTLPNYFLARPGNNSFDFSKNSKNAEIPPIFSHFYNNPYLKDMQAFNAKESPIPPPDHITPPAILTLSPVLPPSLLFDPRYFFVPKELLPPKKQIHPPSSSSTTISNSSRKQACILVPLSFSTYTPTPP
ncbi:hypothetical protein Tco_0635480 [Tanacetum coccineum]